MVYTYALIFFFPQDVHFLESFPTTVSKSQPLFQAKFLFHVLLHVLTESCCY